MGCSRLETCAYFEQGHMQQLEGLASLYRGRYCEGDHEKCARNRVLSVLGEAAVPLDMRPNDHAKAKQMVSGTAAAVS